MSMSKVYVEHVTEARTYASIIGRIVRCSAFVTVTPTGLSHWNLTLRGHDMTFLSATAFNLPKRFPGVAALDGKVVAIHNLQVVANKREFARFGALGARFKEATTVTILPEDPTLPMDVPPLLATEDGDMDDVEKKRERSASVVMSTSGPREKCPNNCRNPGSFVCGKTGEPHIISVCEFCQEVPDVDEPWCLVRRGHRHTTLPLSVPSPSIPSASDKDAPVDPSTSPTSSEEVVPVTY